MRKNEHREQQHGEVCHEYEFILVDGNAFLVSVEKTGIYLTAKQLEDVRHEQQGKNHSNIGNERPLGNSARNKGLTKHCKACGYCDQIKCEHENGTSILNDFAFALQKGKMALGKQRPKNEHQLSAEGEKRHRENKQQQTEYQRNPAVRPCNGIPLELSYRKPMPREHGTNQDRKANDYELLD